MAKKKSNSHIEQVESATEHMSDVERKAFAPNPEAENSKTTKPRFSVTLKEDGSLDLDSMRTETVKRLKELLNDPRTKQLLGSDIVPPEIISEQDIGMLYDLIATIETVAFNVAGKIDMDIAQKHARMTEQQKAMLIPPTKNVIIKHMNPDSFLFKWKDEIVLSALLLMITRSKFEAAKQEQTVRNEQKIRENPATADTAVQ